MSSNENTSLEQLISSKPDLVDYFYNDTKSPHGRANPGLLPVPLEHTNWIDEQQAWRRSVVLFDQSYHMPEMFVRGPEALKFLNGIGINSFEGFVPGKAKQFVGCNPHGQVIGECVLYYLGDQFFELVSGMPLLNWIEYQASRGTYDLTIERDNTQSVPPIRRKRFRFGMDGPNAWNVFEEAAGGSVPDIKFFNTARVQIAGVEVVALRHGMAGHKGVELSGDFAQLETVKAELLRIGRKWDLKQGGNLTYFSASVESGWIGHQVPAIYSSPEMKDYRSWLPANSWEGSSNISGSFRRDDITDYFVTPYDLGYERIMKFDHDFIGREALEKMGPRKRRNVTLVWNDEDIERVQMSMYRSDVPNKMIRYPTPAYGYQHRDAVLAPDGSTVGYSAICAYTSNERKMLSLAVVDNAYAEIGTELELLWGEPDGGSRKPQVERHAQTRIRVTVAPAPYPQAVQSMKRA
ncbi:MAG TPA: aminomethyl transferase family protein [Rhizobiaceae bacterium]|nr:aminomethyl transferase family protein [Rhizobiaceae bacterium]